VSDKSPSDRRRQVRPPEALLARLAEAGSYLLLTHAKPDGDGIGSMLAFARAAGLAGRQARAVLTEPLPRRYAFLSAPDELTGADGLAERAASTEAIVLLDTCAYQQVPDIADLLRSHADKTCVIDHHRTTDPLGAARWIDATAAATGVMVSELIDALGWRIDRAAAEALTVAVVSDTGWLRFSNTDGRTLRAVAGWLDAGVAPDVLYDRLYQSDRPQRLALTRAALDSLAMRAGDRLAVMSLSADDFAETGAEPSETENLINEAMRVGTVELAVMLIETPENIRVSFRSRGRVDVSALASRFGGGGHARAAGARLTKPLVEARRTVMAAAQDALETVADEIG
jgi:phosphoesterase RecJ-like protein